jgi:hypothetical protein
MAGTPNAWPIVLGLEFDGSRNGESGKIPRALPFMMVDKLGQLGFSLSWLKPRLMEQASWTERWAKKTRAFLVRSHLCSTGIKSAPTPRIVEVAAHALRRRSQDALGCMGDDKFLLQERQSRWGW